jgi:hypothetical protein
MGKGSCDGQVKSSHMDVVKEDASVSRIQVRMPSTILHLVHMRAITLVI